MAVVVVPSAGDVGWKLDIGAWQPGIGALTAPRRPGAVQSAGVPGINASSAPRSCGPDPAGQCVDNWHRRGRRPYGL